MLCKEKTDTFVVQRKNRKPAMLGAPLRINHVNEILSWHLQSLPVPETHHEFLDPRVPESQVAHEEANQPKI